MSGSFNDAGELEISDGRLIFLTGKKKSGKSVMAKVIFVSYPGDRVIIDIAGDDGPFGPDIVTLVGDAETLPDKWPEHLRQEKDGKPLPMTLRYVPDAGSATFRDDIDAVIGMALAHSRKKKDRGEMGVLILIHEVGVVTQANRTQPHMRRLLMHNRHNGLTALMCGPRPKDIDPLVLQQSDLVFAFELLNKKDRDRLAESVGWDAGEWSAAMNGLQRHEYLRFDANEEKPDEGEQDLRVLHFPALPEDVAAAADRPLPAQGDRPLEGVLVGD